MGIVFDFIIMVQNIRGLPPKNMGQKHAKFGRHDFRQLQTLRPNIYGTDEDIQNRIITALTMIFPLFANISPVNFGPVTTEI